MNGPGPQANDRLSALLKLPEQQRAERLRRLAPPELAELADHLEKYAMTHVAQALELSEQVVACADRSGDVAARVRARRARAQALAYAGRYPEALPVARESADLAASANLSLEAARSNLASVHGLVGLGRYREAIRVAEQARREFLRLGEPMLAARADSSLGGLYQKLDDPAEALRHFDRARPALGADPVSLAQLESNRGLALQSLDDFEGAEAAFLAALPLFAQAGMDWARAIVENNLAVLMTRQGRLPDALSFFERARRHLERDSAPAELARLLVEQADALATLGLYTQALTQYRAALPALEASGQVREAAQARAGMGRALLQLGVTDEAEAVLEQAARGFEMLHQAVERARVEIVRAELDRRAGRRAAARRRLAEALLALGDLPVDAALVRYHLARLALEDGQLDLATAELEQAISVAGQFAVGPLLADLLHLRGRVHQAGGRAEAAVADFAAAVDRIERIRGSLQAERFRAAFHTDRLEVYADLVSGALEAGGSQGVELAFRTAEQAKGRALLDLAAAGAGRTNKPSTGKEDELTQQVRSLQARLSALYSRLADAHFTQAPTERLRSWQESVSRLEGELADAQARLAVRGGAAALHAAGANLASVQADLARDAALIEYFQTGEELLAFVVRSDRVHVQGHLAAEPSLAERVQRLHFQLRRAQRPGAQAGTRGARRLADTRSALAAVYDRLLRPLADHLTGCTRLHIVPHGLLHTVPFHALWDGRAYVLERYALTYAPSASIWRQRRRTSNMTGTKPADRQPLVVGVPDKRAPQIAREAEVVAAALSARLLLGPSAVADQVLAAMPQADLVHLACHAQFSPANPFASGLKLADRWLTVREIGDLPLTGALVTLSGCETGRNLVTAGDELLGLGRAFLAAGAAALVVSLWVVGDESTLRLMGDFYNRIRHRRADLNLADALRKAQLALAAERPHPAAWAPFILIGDA